MPHVEYGVAVGRPSHEFSMREPLDDLGRSLGSRAGTVFVDGTIMD